MKDLSTAAALMALLATNLRATGTPKLYDGEGNYRGKLSRNPYGAGIALSTMDRRRREELRTGRHAAISSTVRFGASKILNFRSSKPGGVYG